MLVGWTETLRDDCLNAVSDYYSGRKDNSVVSFGKVGKNIMSRLSSRAVMGTELVTVESSSKSQGGSLISLVSRKILYSFKDELDHMEYVRSLSSTTMSGRVALDFISGDQRLEKLTVDEKEFNLRPDDTSERILSSTSSSASFIVLSNFGEAFSQRMHIAFSKLLSKKGIPHLNVVAITGKLSSCSIDMAHSAIDELRNSGERVITFIEGSDVIETVGQATGDFYQTVAKKVNEISQKLAAKANLLKMQVLVS